MQFISLFLYFFAFPDCFKVVLLDELIFFFVYSDEIGNVFSHWKIFFPIEWVFPLKGFYYSKSLHRGEGTEKPLGASPGGCAVLGVSSLQSWGQESAAAFGK